jgi:hypothetical protein
MIDFKKPTIITGQQYGTKISVEIDHSDTDIDELFEAFKTLIVGLGYADYTWKEWIVNKADEYKEEELENSRDMGMYEPSPELRRVAEEYVKELSKRDNETFFDAITNPPQPTDTILKAVEDYVNKLDVSKIDEALSEHNEDEWNDELETQFWNEQPPEPFATPEEVEKYNIDGEFDDYGKRIVKEPKKIGRRGIKKK